MPAPSEEEQALPIDFGRGPLELGAEVMVWMPVAEGIYAVISPEKWLARESRIAS